MPNERGEPILPYKFTKDGFHVLTVHWSKVPGYDFDAACVGMSEDDVNRELEISWDTTTGLRVYPGFNRDIHEATQRLPFDPNRPLFVAWDCPGCPAVALGQLNAYGQLLLYPSLSPEEDEFREFYAFAEFVAGHLQREYADPHGLKLDQLKLIHVGDPAGQYAAPTTKADRGGTQSCYEILRRGVDMFMGEDANGDPIIQNKPGWGWNVIPGELRLLKRVEAVRARLSSLVMDGRPALLVDPRAEFITSGFLGGYCYRQLPDSSYERDPDKNHFSHTHNAIEYMVTRLHLTCNVWDEDDEDTPKVTPFFSQASNRNNR